MKYLLFLVFFGYCTNFAVAGHYDKGKPSIRVVCGTVTDQAGQPLAGSVITNEETGEQFFADLDGRFRIELPANGAVPVAISSIGFVSKRLKGSEFFNFAEYRLSPLN